MFKNKSGAKKVLSIIGTVLTVLILALTAYVVVCIIVSKTQNKPVNLFGYSFALVLSDSMYPEIQKGELIVFKSCSVSDIEVGNDIVFVAGEGFGTMKGQSIVHRVVRVALAGEADVSSENEVDIEGSEVIGFYTQGVNNSSEDKDLVTAENLLGICIYHSAALGVIVTFLTKYGIIILIALVALPFIVKQIIKIVKLAKNGDGEDSGGADGDSK